MVAFGSEMPAGRSLAELIEAVISERRGRE
jgi:hypothetical protein